jgi:hypothetical protein
MNAMEKDLPDEYPKHEDYKDCFVAFIDILGFNNHVKNIKTPNDFLKVARLPYSTKMVANNLNAAHDDILKGFQATAVSDSLIMTVPSAAPACAVGMLQMLHDVQYMFLSSLEFLVRGYISRGNVYHKNSVVFGIGYSDAYEGEKIIGSAPRIVLDPEIVLNAKHDIEQYGRHKYFGTVLDYLKEDPCDGFHFLDYLKPVGGQSVLSKEQLIREHRSIHTFIEQKLKEYHNNYRIYPKYKWLENYYQESAKYF